MLSKVFLVHSVRASYTVEGLLHVSAEIHAFESQTSRWQWSTPYGRPVITDFIGW